MKVIGLTGGIASGKSTVSEILSKLGAPVIDADKIAREVVEPGQKSLDEIADAFGSDILNDDGTINRKKLGSIVFNDTAKLQKLNSITHPEIIRVIKERLKILRNKHIYKAVIIDAPMLFESGCDSLTDEVWLVYVDLKTQLERLKARDNIDTASAKLRIMSQMPIEEKLKLSQKVIDNTGDFESLKRQVLMLWNDTVERS